jgi:hypothetical protein
MKPEIMIVFGIFLTFAILEAVFTSLQKKPNQTRADVIVESVSTVATLGLIQPFIVLMSATLLGWAIPIYQGALADLGWPSTVGTASHTVCRHSTICTGRIIMASI